MDQVRGEPIPVGSLWVEHETVAPRVVTVRAVSASSVEYGDVDTTIGAYRPWAFVQRFVKVEPLDNSEALHAELRALRRWKAEALTVLEVWEAVWNAAGRPGRVSQSKAEAVLELFIPESGR